VDVRSLTNAVQWEAIEDLYRRIEWLEVELAEARRETARLREVLADDGR
jgi:hypothetical protein